MSRSNQTLSFPRLGKLIQHEVNINRQIYIMIIPLAMLSFMAVLFFTFFVSNSFSVMGYIPFLFIGYFIMCIFLTGKSFPALGNKYGGTIYLTLPASTFEKFLVQGIFKLAIPFLLYPFVFWLTANISVEIFQKITSFLTASIEAESGTKSIEKFSFYGSGMYKQDNEPLLKTLVIALYIAIPSIFLLGSISFKKFMNVKTPISFFLLAFCYVCFLVLLSHILFPEITYGFQVSLNLGPFVMKDIPLIILIAIIYICLIPIMALTATYLKLKEREV